MSFSAEKLHDQLSGSYQKADLQKAEVTLKKNGGPEEKD